MNNPYKCQVKIIRDKFMLIVDFEKEDVSFLHDPSPVMPINIRAVITVQEPESVLSIWDQTSVNNFLFLSGLIHTDNRLQYVVRKDEFALLLNNLSTMSHDYFFNILTDDATNALWFEEYNGPERELAYFQNAFPRAKQNWDDLQIRKKQTGDP